MIGKFGRVLPILFLRRKDGKKIAKFDPSKTLHCLKKVKVDEDSQDNSFENLTWNLVDRNTSGNYERSRNRDSMKRPLQEIQEDQSTLFRNIQSDNSDSNESHATPGEDSRDDNDGELLKTSNAFKISSKKIKYNFVSTFENTQCELNPKPLSNSDSLPAGDCRKCESKWIKHYIKDFKHNSNGETEISFKESCVSNDDSILQNEESIQFLGTRNHLISMATSLVSSSRNENGGTKQKLPKNKISKVLKNKKQISNKLRLETLKERKEVLKNRKEIVKNALQKVDAGSFIGGNRFGNNQRNSFGEDESNCLSGGKVGLFRFLFVTHL